MGVVAALLVVTELNEELDDILPSSTPCREAGNARDVAACVGCARTSSGDKHSAEHIFALSAVGEYALRECLVEALIGVLGADCVPTVDERALRKVLRQVGEVAETLLVVVDGASGGQVVSSDSFGRFDGDEDVVSEIRGAG